MVQENWKPPATASGNPDPGAFGKEFERRVWEELELVREKENNWRRYIPGLANWEKRWYTNVWIREDTLEIVAVGEYPRGVRYDGLVQIDAMYVESRYVPKVGEKLKMEKILDAYDLKTPDGYIFSQQANRLRQVLSKPSIKTVASPIVWDRASGKLLPNTRYARAVKIFSLVSAGLGIAASLRAIISINDYNEEFDGVLRALEEVRNAETDEWARLLAAQAVVRINSYLSHFVPDDSFTNTITVFSVYRIIGR
ncbi:hypothetical protein HRbin36_00304 [bacterium HR36]|nr:hypothetical protein HRbin36_00304 [bacterium HR36]